MRWWNIYSKICVVVLIILGVAIWLGFFSPLPFEQAQYTKFQSMLAVISAIAVIFTLIYATIQFRRTIAKPKIRINFDEKGKTEGNITIPEKDRSQSILDLFITNMGDAVAYIFQIDLEIPRLYHPEMPSLYDPKFKEHITINQSNKNNDIQLVSICNNGMPFFVNRPTKILYLSFILNATDSNQYSADFEIQYKIYGSWAESQQGKLKVRCIRA